MTVPAPFVFDPAVKTHARTLERLETEQVAWLGTIGRDGYPHAVPIWFLWQDGRALIMSEPETAKVRNIRANDRVLLHLEAGADGEQLNVLPGVATLSPQPSTAWLPRIAAPYTAKYDAALFDPALTANVVFSQHNLVTDHSFSEFNAILCRNVMIYFDKNLQTRVHDLFYDSLVRFGILALGRKESLRFTKHESRYEKLDAQERIYRKVR